MILCLEAVQDLFVMVLSPTDPLFFCQNMVLVHHWVKVHLFPVHGREIINIQHLMEEFGSQV